MQLFTHTWALNGSEYRTSTISVSQSTLTHLHAHSHRNFKHTCTRRREEGRGFQGEGQHERTRPWTTEADIRRGGGGGNRGSRAGGSGGYNRTTPQHGALQKHVQQWGRGRGQGHSSLRVSSGIAVFFLQ